MLGIQELDRNDVSTKFLDMGGAGRPVQTNRKWKIPIVFIEEGSRLYQEQVHWQLANQFKNGLLPPSGLECGT